MAKLLTVDSTSRLSAVQALEHPWVQGKCFASSGADKGEGGEMRGNALRVQALLKAHFDDVDPCVRAVLLIL